MFKGVFKNIGNSWGVGGGGSSQTLWNGNSWGGGGCKTESLPWGGGGGYGYFLELHILFLTDQMKGFLSIIELIGQFMQQISMVFHRYFTACDNQHNSLWLHKEPVRLMILQNFEVHKLGTRKNYLTETLRRSTEPHCGITKPLWRNIIDFKMFTKFSDSQSVHCN